MLLFFLFSGHRRLSLGFWFFVCSFLLPPPFVDGEICWVASCESAHEAPAMGWLSILFLVLVAGSNGCGEPLFFSYSFQPMDGLVCYFLAMVFGKHNFIWCYLLIRKRRTFHASVSQALLVGPFHLEKSLAVLPGCGLSCDRANPLGRGLHPCRARSGKRKLANSSGRRGDGTSWFEVLGRNVENPRCPCP